MPALIYGLFAAMLYSIVSIIPFIAIQTFHFTPQIFGFLFFLTYFGYLFGSITASSISHKFSPYQAILTGIIIAIISESVLVVTTILNIADAWLLFTCIFFILFSLPFVFVNASVLGLANHENKSSASSVLNFINVAIACVAVFICGLVKDNFLVNLSLVLLVITLLAAVLLTIVFISRIKLVSLKPIKVVVRD
jgi:MFS transporter, DHA1 family, multidrug resistance protein